MLDIKLKEDEGQNERPTCTDWNMQNTEYAHGIQQLTVERNILVSDTAGDLKGGTPCGKSGCIGVKCFRVKRDPRSAGCEVQVG